MRDKNGSRPAAEVHATELFCFSPSLLYCNIGTLEGNIYKREEEEEEEIEEEKEEEERRMRGLLSAVGHIDRFSVTRPLAGSFLLSPFSLFSSISYLFV